MHNKTLTLAIFLAALGTAPAAAADSGDGAGKALLQENCTGCHDDGMYTRANRRVTSLEGLQKQVRRCELSLGLSWFDEDIAAVTSYLNNTYYRFK